MEENKNTQELANKLKSIFEDFGYKNINLEEVLFTQSEDKNDVGIRVANSINRSTHCKLVRNPHTGKWEVRCT